MIWRSPERPGMMPCDVRRRTSCVLSAQVCLISACVAAPVGDGAAVALEELWAGVMDAVPPDAHAAARRRSAAAATPGRLTCPTPAGTAAGGRRPTPGRRRRR